MSKDFSRQFYSSQAWNNCREAYKKSVGYLCEDCLRKGIIKPCEIVHHIIELTPDNINNPDITMNFNNLRAVCRECHAEEHGKITKRYKVLPDGSVETK